MQQLLLPLHTPIFYKNFKPKPSEATLWIDKWPDWGRHKIIFLIGSEDRNKLAALWANKAKACVLSFHRAFAYHPFDCPYPQKCLVLEDIDKAWGKKCNEWLFHFCNNEQELRRSVILTAERHYTDWPVHLNDLYSRLCTYPLVHV